MSGIVEFKPDVACFTYTCSWGCYGFDFEGEQEALDALLNHDCDRGA